MMDRNISAAFQKFCQAVTLGVIDFPQSTKQEFINNNPEATGWIAGVMYTQSMEENNNE